MKRERKYKIMWRNPNTGRVCYVAAEGLTLVRVEDVVQDNSPRNTRVMTYEHLKIELMEMKYSFMPMDEKQIIVIPQKRVYQRV